MRILLLAIICLQSAASLGQQLSNSDFRLAYSGQGLSSLRRVQDLFDTNYIAGGRALGDVYIRYRTNGQSTWKEGLSAMAVTGVGQRVSYKIGRTVPTIANSSHTSSSIGPWGLDALNDQIEPQSSSDTDVPFFAWGDRHGSQEWVQYDFETGKEISSAEVYWAIGSRDEFKWSLPVSWRLQYQDHDKWRDVETSDKYGTTTDQFNRVTFRPVTTRALRLLAQLPTDATSGIFEWRVNTDKG